MISKFGFEKFPIVEASALKVDTTDDRTLSMIVGCGSMIIELVVASSKRRIFACKLSSSIARSLQLHNLRYRECLRNVTSVPQNMQGLCCSIVHRGFPGHVLVRRALFFTKTLLLQFKHVFLLESVAQVNTNTKDN